MKIQSIILSRPMLKVHAVILGFSIWFIISQSHIVSTTRTVPLSFYHQRKNRQIYAPEAISITAFGPKGHLNQLFHSEYAVHINLNSYKPGTHKIELSQEDLFLPQTVKLLQLNPSIIQIKIAE